MPEGRFGSWQLAEAPTSDDGARGYSGNVQIAQVLTNRMPGQSREGHFLWLNGKRQHTPRCLAWPLGRFGTEWAVRMAASCCHSDMFDC